MRKTIEEKEREIDREILGEEGIKCRKVREGNGNEGARERR